MARPPSPRAGPWRRSRRTVARSCIGGLQRKEQGRKAPAAPGARPRRRAGSPHARPCQAHAGHPRRKALRPARLALRDQMGWIPGPRRGEGRGGPPLFEERQDPERAVPTLSPMPSPGCPSTPFSTARSWSSTNRARPIFSCSRTTCGRAGASSSTMSSTSSITTAGT